MLCLQQILRTRQGQSDVYKPVNFSQVVKRYDVQAGVMAFLIFFLLHWIRILPITLKFTSFQKCCLSWNFRRPTYSCRCISDITSFQRLSSRLFCVKRPLNGSVSHTTMWQREGSSMVNYPFTLTERNPFSAQTEGSFDTRQKAKPKYQPHWTCEM